MKQKDAVEMENASIKVANVRMDSMVNTVAKNIAQKIAVDVVNAVTTEFVNAILDLAAKHVMNNIVCQ
jgi:UDP-N-acetyl-D-mannosaminuronic acid transferase (WecB/TagA/CpsF family)